MAEIAEAMQAAHEAGVIHRDLKPQNVLITQEDLPKVTDFGLARITDESALSQTGDIAGTYLYMSPEQVAARRAGLDHRTDVFSLGIVLYELLALRRPFEGDTTQQVAEQILFRDPPDPRTVRSKVPRDLAVIANHALEKELDKRYQTMKELAADLRRTLANEPILATPPTWLDRAVKWAKRNPGKSSAAAIDQRPDELVQRARGSGQRRGQRAEVHPELCSRRLCVRPGLEHGPEPRPVLELSLQALQLRQLRMQLEKLVQGLTAFADEATGLLSGGISEEHGWGMEKRLASAQELRRAFAPDSPEARAWSAALLEIRGEYPELTLTPQLGLLPLGRDPHSGLWEFAHLETGEPAARDAAGKLALNETTGLVFVLLPGGTFQMGAQKKDPDGPNHDPDALDGESPVRAVTLSAFFLSKYEMTQGQWERFAGRNPSNIAPGETWGGKRASRAHPVEQVSWFDCTQVMERLGLSLPSEAQWEYGARGGTQTVWWTGNGRDSLIGAVNLADRAAHRDGQNWADIGDWPELDDGYVVHAPVAAFLPNGFGLHNVHGNVWEWCLDAYDYNFYETAASRDPVASPANSSTRVVRGGGFDTRASQTRSAIRLYSAPSVLGYYLGLRPARTIAP